MNDYIIESYWLRNVCKCDVTFSLLLVTYTYTTTKKMMSLLGIIILKMFKKIREHFWENIVYFPRACEKIKKKLENIKITHSRKIKENCIYPLK